MLLKIFYNLAFFAYAVVALPLFMAKGKHRDRFGERLGKVPAEDAARLAKGQVLWVHAVSAGEVRLACHLVSRIRHRLPGWQLLVTTTTASGREIARQRLAAEDTVLYFPFDASFALRRFLDAVRPKAAVFLETEMWPNLLLELSRRGVPSIIVNGRVSAEAFKRYRFARWALGPALRVITACLAQSQEHAQRFTALGVPQERVKVAGNMKFDLEGVAVPRKELEAAFTLFKSEPDAAIWFASSTHPGEEEMVLDCYQRLKGLHPSLRLVLAPRHIERVPAVEALVRKHGLSSVRLTGLLGEQRTTMSEILLVDSWGILNDLYTFADIVFVGGSLVPIGGHNIAEPAFAAKPIVHGPFMNNFKDMVEEFGKAGAALRVADAAALESETHKLLRNPERRAALGLSAKETVARNQGATNRCIEGIVSCLSRAQTRAAVTK